MSAKNSEIVKSNNPVAVVIPCYRVRKHIVEVISRIGPEVSRIFVVDDACPEKSGAFAQEMSNDPRVTVIIHEHNQGVGGAVMTGYRAAINEMAEVIVKVDGDGQMDPHLIPHFIRPILQGEADYVKGNRFFDLTLVRAMPRVRLVGNAALSFLAKLSTGYWDLFDPTNGYTALSGKVAPMLPFEKISSRYFFESDMLFRLGVLRALVVDVPMKAVYGDEVSGMNLWRVLGEFSFKHARNFAKRVFYNYFLRDFNIASVELVIGAILFAFGFFFGLSQWMQTALTGQVASAGTVMLAALPVIIGAQMLLSFVSYDINNRPSRPLTRGFTSVVHGECD